MRRSTETMQHPAAAQEGRAASPARSPLPEAAPEAACGTQDHPPRLCREDLDCPEHFRRRLSAWLLRQR